MNKNICGRCGSELVEMQIGGKWVWFCVSCLIREMDAEERKRASKKLKLMNKESEE